jgi:hypothetical protein
LFTHSHAQRIYARTSGTEKSRRKE